MDQAFKITREGTNIHVRFRSPRGFSEFSTPAWASNAASKMAEDDTGLDDVRVKVRMGYVRKNDKWLIQSILIPISSGLTDMEALSLASYIYFKLDIEGKKFGR